MNHYPKLCVYYFIAFKNTAFVVYCLVLLVFEVQEMILCGLMGLAFSLAIALLRFTPVACNWTGV